MVNVKPFAPEVGRGHIGIDEAIEMIDVGGAALLGAAARNAAGVTAVAGPAHYPVGARGARALGQVSAETRHRLAADAFGAVAAYYAEIAAYLNQVSGNTFPQRLALVLEKVADLGYGENPHQRGGVLPRDDAPIGLARRRHPAPGRAAHVQQPARPRRGLPDRRGLYDARRSSSPSTRTRSGIASADELVEAYRKALETDPVACFGGIVGVNRELDGADGPRDRGQLVRGGRGARLLARRRSAILRGKPGLELLAVPPSPTEGMRDYGIANLDFKRVGGGLLVEALDARRPRPGPAAGRDPPAPDAGRAHRPAVRLAGGPPRPVQRDRPRPEHDDGRHRRRAGEPQRRRSRSPSDGRAIARKLAVMASDAYFPFPDGIQIAANAGVTAIIQPGGSIRDEMAIEVADRHHLAMVFTGRRHFRH